MVVMDYCLGCTVSCCRNYFIPLTCSDVKRLVERGLDPLDYIDFSRVGSIESAYPDVRLGDGYYYMVLRRRADEACALSSESSGNLICSIHGSHPTVCRLYPFDEFTGGFRGKVTCERYGRADFDVGELADKRRSEHEEYALKVRQWNGSCRERRSAPDFISFLLD